MIADADIWQVMCGGDIYQADLATLKQWVAEGLVQQTDQVRKGNLRWLEAGRVPALRRVFTGEEQIGAPTPQPVAHAAESHAQHAHGGVFQQAAHDLPVYHAAPAEPSHFSHAAQPHAPQHYAPDPFAAPAQQYAPDPFADPAGQYSDPFAPPAQHYAGDVFVSPADAHAAAPPPDAFDAPRYTPDPARYAPETSHYAVGTPGFTPEAVSHAPSASRGDAYAAAPPPHGAHAADPFFVPLPEQSGETVAAHAAPAPHVAHVPDRREFAERAAAAPSLRALGRTCYAHPNLQPRYVCRVCQTPMCGDCARFVDGSRVALCPLCGDICHDYRQVYTQARSRVRKASGFGLADFGEAIGYPFRNLLGLIMVSVFYSILSLGGIKGHIVAWVVIFGCMSLVIKQVAWGRMDRGFLPDFTAMSLWDDMLVPCFLGIGVTIITWGLAIVLFLMLVWGMFAGFAKQPVTVHNPGLAIHEEQFARDTQDLINSTDPENDAERLERVRRATVEGPEAVYSEPESEAAALGRRLASGAMGPLLLLLPLLAVALLWGFFYYPMALIVAGYTEDFWAVVNPLVGFDTIRRMGWNYVKVFLMYALVQLFALVAGFLVSYALSDFDMPLFGNIPARFIESGLSFYTSLVTAALLGLALYKSSDRLGIATD